MDPLESLSHLKKGLQKKSEEEYNFTIISAELFYWFKNSWDCQVTGDKS